MRHRAHSIAYGLAIFVLMNALFVISDTNIFKKEVQEAFRVGFLQTIGDQPWFENLEVAITGIVDFYDQSASAMTALISPTYAEDDLFYIANQAYLVIAGQAGTINEEGEVAGLLYEGEYMQDAPLYNIHPDFNSAPQENTFTDKELSEWLFSLVIPDMPAAWRFRGNDTEGAVAGEQYSKPVNGPNEWITIQDNYTGQLYCLAIYNGETNKYLGECKYDENF